MRGNKSKEQKANHIVSAWCDMEFSALGRKKETKSNNGYKITKEKAHSQIEIREYYQCDRLKWMEGKSRWKGIKSIEMDM